MYEKSQVQRMWSVQGCGGRGAPARSARAHRALLSLAPPAPAAPTPARARDNLYSVELNVNQVDGSTFFST